MSMAELIAKRRKENGMTQMQLANKLGVTDKAVSKWERGNGQPDINYLEPLAGALGVTVSELLRGEMENEADAPADEDNSDETIIKKTLDYANSVYEAKSRSMPRMVMISFLALGLAGIITTTIVDFAISGAFTWSLLPISAIVFAWLCVIPMLLFEKRSVDISLVSISLFILPFLYVLSRLTGGAWFTSVAIPMSIAGVVILWAVRAVWWTKLGVWNKGAVSLLIGAVGTVAINFVLGAVLFGGGPAAWLDVWDLMAVAIFIVAAVILFVIGRMKRVIEH